MFVQKHMSVGLYVFSNGTKYNPKFFVTHFALIGQQSCKETANLNKKQVKANAHIYTPIHIWKQQQKQKVNQNPIRRHKRSLCLANQKCKIKHTSLIFLAIAAVVFAVIYRLWINLKGNDIVETAHTPTKTTTTNIISNDVTHTNALIVNHTHVQPWESDVTLEREA